MADRPLSNLVVRVSADISNFTRGMTNTDKAANQAATKLRRMSSVSIAALAAAGAAALRFGAQLNDLGQDVIETESKFNEVTGASKDMANEYIESMAGIAGATRSELQGVIANLANVAQGAGFATDAATELATEMTTLAGDLGSFNNIPVAQVAKDITSALTGEREAMKKYGIVVKQTEVDTQALQMTGKTLTSQLTEQDRVLASSAILFEKAGAAIGDMSRTSESAARQSEQLAGHLRQMKEDLGVIVSNAVGGAFTTLLATMATAGASVTTGIRELTEQYGFLNAISALVATGSIENAAAMLANNATVREATVDTAALAAANRSYFESLQALAAGLDGMSAEVGTLNAGYQRLVGGEREVIEWSHNMGESLVGMAIDVGEIVVPAIDGMTQGLRDQGSAAEQTALKLDTVTGAASRMMGVFRSGGSFLSKLGGILGAVAPLLGPLGGIAGLAGGILSGFATGGQLGPGGVGVVGENGPEVIQAGRQGATITPNQDGRGGGGGDINISLVMDTGRALVDTITVKQDRDKDVRRIIRVPVSAMAVG